MSKFSEAMALASFNPIPSYNTFLVNTISYDKDLRPELDGIGSSLGLLDKFGGKTSIYKLDGEGKIIKKSLYDNDIEIDEAYMFQLGEDTEDIIQNIREEAELQDYEKPVHGLNYFYEVITGKELLSEDQLIYDTSLVKLNEEAFHEVVGYELEKFSTVMAGHNDANQTLRTRSSTRYIPDTDFPQGTKNLSNPDITTESVTCERFRFH